MFAGIVEETAEVVALDRSREPASFQVRSGLDHAATKLGDSICIDGVCLSVVAVQNNVLRFDLVSETLRATRLGDLAAGSKVNLERALKLGDTISGHFVSGHVDQCVELKKRVEDQGTTRLVFSLPDSLKRFICPKGSVTLNGVSLTVGEVQDGTFSVYIIPHTAQVTNLGELKIGAKVNLEIDILARYVVNNLAAVV